MRIADGAYKCITSQDMSMDTLISQMETLEVLVNYDYVEFQRVNPVLAANTFTVASTVLFDMPKLIRGSQ